MPQTTLAPGTSQECAIGLATLVDPTRSDDVSGNRGGERGAAEPELAALAAPIVNNSLQGVIQAPPRPSWISPNENPHRLPGTTFLYWHVMVPATMKVFYCILKLDGQE